jgi:hypothetical protein
MGIYKSLFISNNIITNKQINNRFFDGPGVSPTSPWASATPQPKATNEKINKYYEYMMIF